MCSILNIFHYLCNGEKKVIPWHLQAKWYIPAFVANQVNQAVCLVTAAYNNECVWLCKLSFLTMSRWNFHVEKLRESASSWHLHLMYMTVELESSVELRKYTAFRKLINIIFFWRYTSPSSLVSPPCTHLFPVITQFPSLNPPLPFLLCPLWHYLPHFPPHSFSFTLLPQSHPSAHPSPFCQLYKAKKFPCA